jgi:DNA primase
MAEIAFQKARAENPLPQVVGAHVRLQRAGNEWKGCCPFHPDKTPSFTIFDGGDRFHCFGCGASGDVLDYVRRLHDVTLVEAARMLGAGDLPRVDLPNPPASKQRRDAEALKIWEQAFSARNSPAEAYLRARGITTAIPPAIRYTRLPYGASTPKPCLVAAVRDVAGNVTGIQRIFLTEDGKAKAWVPKPKLSLGTVAGGAIRLGDPPGMSQVIVCEGPEDGLSLMQMFNRAVWVAAGASLMPAMRFPPTIQSVIVAIDNDKAGRREAHKAVTAYRFRGLDCRILRPGAGFKDFNDELRGTR